MYSHDYETKTMNFEAYMNIAKLNCHIGPPRHPNEKGLDETMKTEVNYCNSWKSVKC